MRLYRFIRPFSLPNAIFQPFEVYELVTEFIAAGKRVLRLRNEDGFEDNGDPDDFVELDTIPAFSSSLDEEELF